MAHEVFTGKSGGSSITFDADSIPTGWKKITIAEKGKPLAGQLDTTAAGATAYSFTDDPLGGKGSPSCTVTVEGLMSKTDVHDSGLLASTIDATGDVVVTTGAASDEFTLSDAVYKGMRTGAGFADVQPYTATFTLASSAGSWATAS